MDNSNLLLELSNHPGWKVFKTMSDDYVTYLKNELLNCSLNEIDLTRGKIFGVLDLINKFNNEVDLYLNNELISQSNKGGDLNDYNRR